ncbi:IS21 family transposase [Noviherbaspirillum galbum]|uniref:IS21 family transposase n=1 Tax=Noviherbaspirillum galbum TaxID=2709383 RepID=A0A6B3SRB0_9BURK|nr:IS21 family transposase [Noviherbaspirillum galbum]NEX60952.1 IS21 family transposase [Noviherbaspirillum galbum]
MGILAKIRRLHLRDKLSIREIARRTNLSRNTIRHWLRQPDMTELTYPDRQNKSIVDPYVDQLRQWIGANSHRPKRDRRTSKAMFEALKAQGYAGSYTRIAIRARQLRQELNDAPNRKAFVPLAFAHGDAFQFDWSCEYVFIGGLRRRLEVAHCKLASSRAFWLVAYYTQSLEMLFDAHTRSFAAFGGIPRRGVYDNMKTAVDRVHKGKEHTVNARFDAMCGHYLFEPDFCNIASGWEKGIVEKNVQDRRRQIWHQAAEQRWKTLAELNVWLAEQCIRAWETMSHPQWPAMTVADVLQDERVHLMPMPKAFDGYVEQPVRVSATSLIHFQRNRYSIPTPHAHQVVSLRIYPDTLVIVADGEEVARHVRQFERLQTCYDWQHYIPIIGQKPGALRNGAPFAGMPEPLLHLQRHLLKHPGGDRVMAQVLSAVPVHGLDAVLVAVELALESGRPSGEHVINVLGRLKGLPPEETIVSTPLRLKEEPVANVDRYEQLRTILENEHVD